MTSQPLRGAGEPFIHGLKTKDKGAELFQQIGRRQIELTQLNNNLSCFEGFVEAFATVSIAYLCSEIGLPKHSVAPAG